MYACMCMCLGCDSLWSKWWLQLMDVFADVGATSAPHLCCFPFLCFLLSVCEDTRRTRPKSMTNGMLLPLPLGLQQRRPRHARTHARTPSSLIVFDGCASSLPPSLPVVSIIISLFHRSTSCLSRIFCSQINVNPKNATSPRPKRQLNPQAIKRRLSSSSVNQEVRFC